MSACPSTSRRRFLRETFAFSALALAGLGLDVALVEAREPARWDPAQRETDARHGMPADVAQVLHGEGLLRSDGPHAPSTVKRRLASWGTLHRWKGIEGPFGSPALRSAARFAWHGQLAPEATTLPHEQMRGARVGIRPRASHRAR